MTNKLKGVIFDFNGTLFYDTPLHIEAWREYSKILRGTPFSDEEMRDHMIGRTNADIIAYAIGKMPDKETELKYGNEKEALYREMCLENKDETKLITGACELFDFLVEHDIPHTIATGSNKENVDFFIEVFNLNKWFDVSKIVYDDGSFASKPSPEMYFEAAKKLDLNPCECLIFEDSGPGLESAKRANAGAIIAVAPQGGHCKSFELAQQVIKDFCEFDKSILL